MRAFTRTAVLALAAMAAAGRAQAQVPACMLGEVRTFAGNFAPVSWALAQGQILPISQNTALFSLLGTMYGGNGQTTFALPDYRSRFAIGFGQGPGLSQYDIGQTGGQETVTQTVNEMPPHNHLVKVSTSFGNFIRPQGRILAKVNPMGGPEVYIDSSLGDADLAPDAVSTTGGGQPQPNLPPYLGMNFIICIQGFFPARQ